MNSSLKSYFVHLSLFLVALIYAANYTIAKWVMPAYINPLAFIFIRVASGAIFFFAFYRFFVFEKITHLRHYIQLFIAAIFGVAVNMLCFFEGLALTTPINASVLMLFTPIFVVLFVSFFSDVKLRFVNYLGILIAFFGALFMVGFQSLNLNSKHALGDLLIIINAVSYAFYLYYVKRLLVIYKPFTVVAYIFAFGLIIITPFALQSTMETEWWSLVPKAWFAIIFVLVFVTIVTYFLNTWAMVHSNSTLVGAYIYLQPVLAALIAIILGADTLSWFKVLCGLIIVFGVYLVSKKN